MSQNVVMLGAGRIGSAIGSQLSQKGAMIEMWDKDTSLVPNQKPLEEIIPNADFLFLCTPSRAFRPAIKGIEGLIKKETIVISLAKSIEAESRKTMDELLEEILPNGQPFVILAGPLMAEELSGPGGVAVIAAKEKSTTSRVEELFKDSGIRTELSSDVHGAALCGVLKNIYAIGLGSVDGIGWGDNLKGWFAGRAICEMLTLIEVLGGKRETFCGTAGLGDFITTGFSKSSGHRGFGETLATGATCEMNKEGCLALPSILSLLGEKASSFSTLKVMERILIDQENPKKVLDEFLVS